MHSLLVITLVSTPVDDLLKTVSGSKTHQSIKIEEQVVVPDVYIYCATITDPDTRNENISTGSKDVAKCSKINSGNVDPKSNV